MKRFGIISIITILFLAGCGTQETVKEEKKEPPKAVERRPASIDTRQETLAACLRTHTDAQGRQYCDCYADEFYNRVEATGKKSPNELTPQERGQVAVMSAMACKKFRSKNP